MKRLMVVLAVVAVFVFSLSVTDVMAQIDYCEGNFDNDLDQDGTDAFVFKQDFGRSSLLNPCPQIECQTVEQLEMRIAQLEALLANVTRSTIQGQDTIRFSGVNVQIVDGSGDTYGTVNGRGNLIVGYNENRNDGTDDRTGSHNIVVGIEQNYSNFGGLVAGLWNTISGPYASVSGGSSNTASGQAASVSGGGFHTASGQNASLTGGMQNTASGAFSSASGGFGNIATGQYASVSGGDSNRATVYAASVGGGQINEAIGAYAFVAGGRNNVASGDYSFVGGGGGEIAEDEGNTAFGNYSAVLGGKANIAGDPARMLITTVFQQCFTVIN